MFGAGDLLANLRCCRLTLFEGCVSALRTITLFPSVQGRRNGWKWEGALAPLYLRLIMRLYTIPIIVSCLAVRSVELWRTSPDQGDWSVGIQTTSRIRVLVECRG